MTPTEGVMKRFALLIALITTLFATPAVAHAAKVKLTGVPASLSQGDAFTVKGSAKTDGRADAVQGQEVRQAGRQAREVEGQEGQVRGQGHDQGHAGQLLRARVRGQGVHGEGDQGHGQGRPRRPAAGAERSCERPDLASRPGQREPAARPDRHADARPRQPGPDADPGPRGPEGRRPGAGPRRRDLGLRRHEVPLLRREPDPAQRRARRDQRRRPSPSCAAPSRTARASRSRA